MQWYITAERLNRDNGGEVSLSANSANLLNAVHMIIQLAREAGVPVVEEALP